MRHSGIKSRGEFATKFGVLMATVGSAVGLGNIWRFPYQVGQNGGGAYLLVYAFAVLLIGIPAMVSEFIVGRGSKANAVDAFKKLSPTKGWKGIGYLGVFTGFVIDCYYCVVTGWTLYYLYKAVGGTLLGRDTAAYKALFDSFSAGVVTPIIALVIVIILTGIVVSRGIKNGIEKASKFMMPLLFLLLIVLAVNSCLMNGSAEGLKYIFVPNFSNFTFSTFHQAIGQAFFSLSIGMACLVTYSSYFSKDVSLPSTAAKISIMDMCVAILAGVIIFPAVFSFGNVSVADISADPETYSGPGLVFQVIPNVFDHMAGGYIWSLMFYLLLFLAALTSFISITEVVVAYVSESFNLTRVKATAITSVLFILLGTVCSLSFGPLSGVTLFDKKIFGLVDALATNFLLPIGGIFISLFVGWRLDRKIVETQLGVTSPKGYRFLKVYIFFLRYIVPAAVLFIMVAGLAGA